MEYDAWIKSSAEILMFAVGSKNVLMVMDFNTSQESLAEF